MAKNEQFPVRITSEQSRVPMRPTAPLSPAFLHLIQLKPGLIDDFKARTGGDCIGSRSKDVREKLAHKLRVPMIGG